MRAISGQESTTTVGCDVGRNRSVGVNFKMSKLHAGR